MFWDPTSPPDDPNFSQEVKLLTRVPLHKMRMGAWAHGRMGGAKPSHRFTSKCALIAPSSGTSPRFRPWAPGASPLAARRSRCGLALGGSRAAASLQQAVQVWCTVVQGASRRSRPAGQRLALHLHAACAQLRLPRRALASRLCRCATWTVACGSTIPTSPRTCSRDGTSCRRGRCAGISLAGLPAGCGHLGARHLCCPHACLRLMQGSQPRHLVRTFALPEPLLRPSWPLHRWRARHRPGQAHQTTLTTTTRTAMARTPPASLAR